MKFRVAPAWLMFMACSHPDPFSYNAPDVGPSTAGADVLLTQNAVNYWPTLTEDRSGVLYAYIDESEAPVRPISQFESPPYVVGPLHIHRCMGEVPVNGGTRHWEFCDRRASEIDSLTSLTAFAMGSDGRLIYAESTTPRRFTFDSTRVSLWLADSATPFRRTLLVRLPIVVGDNLVNWIGDLTWTGPTTFLALGQRMTLTSHGATSLFDSSFSGQGILRGTTSVGPVSLTPVPGTIGATAYAVTDSGRSIVFAQLDSTNLLKVPISGGAPMPVASGVAAAGAQVVGLSCTGARCVVAIGAGGPSLLRSVNLTTGAVATVFTSGQAMSMPLLTGSGDVIVQVGPGFGRIRTLQAAVDANNPSRPVLTLHLYKGLVAP